FNGSTLQALSPSSPFAPGMGIVRNRNCPACRNLRRFVANLVGARRCAKTLFGADHFQRDVPQRSRGGDSISVPAALHIRSKDACSVNSAFGGRVRPKMETARLPGCRRHANRRLTPSPSAKLQRSVCNENSKTDARAFERKR